MRWRWAHDRVDSTCEEYDKLIHLRSAFGGTLALLALGVPPLWAGLLALTAGVLWEVKDALTPYEEHGYAGGDGFSWWDLLADAAGIGLALLAWRLGPYG